MCDESRPQRPLARWAAGPTTPGPAGIGSAGTRGAGAWLLATAGFTILYLVATYAGRLTVMDSTNLSLVWPAAGVSAVWFLAQHRSRWRWADVLALSAVTILVNRATGTSFQLAAFFVVANVAQAILFGYLFRRWLPHLWGGGGDRPLARLEELWLLVAAAFLSTAFGALIGPTGVWLADGSYSWAATAVWLTRNTVSILLIGVAAIRLGHTVRVHAAGHRGNLVAAARTRWSATSVLRRLEYLAVVVVSATSYYLVFGVVHGLPLAFTLIVLTVWAGVRLDTSFVIVHNLVFGTAAILFTLHHTGVFATIGSHATRALVAQVFVGMVTVVGLALALGRDERAQLFEELRTERQTAADQARLMGAIVDSMREGLTVVDEQGRFLLRNAAIRDLLGVVSDGGALANPEYYGLFHPDGRPLAAEDMPNRRALSGSDVVGMDLLVRNPGLPEGRILNVSCTAIPGGRDGSRYAVTVFHDVTAERRHRDELMSFAGVVAHDLLNPLATVQGWTEALADVLAAAPDHPGSAEAADGAVRIRRAAARMRNLINDLLDYTTARDAAVAAVDVSVADVLTDIATARVDQAESHGAPVPVFRIAAPHAVHADLVLLRQLLDNLVSNAIKYTAPGVTPELTITTERAGDLVTISVCDNGIGIPAGQHHTIFDNFQRAHRTAGYTGTGLGLGICKRIVERHGGTISAGDNPAGQGSRFVFTLPAEGTAVPGPARKETRPSSLEPDRPAPPAVADTRPDAPMPPIGQSFQYAAQVVLDYLHDQLPLAFWAVTRVENGRQTYIYLDADNGYGLRQGGSHPWQDSFCVHMAAGRAPTVALDAQTIPQYARAGVNDSIDIGTYAGAVISEPDGTLFGAICGLDPQARTDDSRLAAAQPLLALLGRLLTAALAADRTLQRAQNVVRLDQMLTETDPSTGLPGRLAWQRMTGQAQARFERLADPMVVAMVELQGDPGGPAGDAALATAAAATRRAVRDSDVIARTGGDELGVLLLDCTEATAGNIVARVHAELAAAGARAAIGWAPITMQQDVSAALQRATAELRTATPDPVNLARTGPSS